MQCISFSGVDGSGKSTQLEMMRERLVSQGKKVAYFHAVEFSLANKIARFFKGEKHFQPGKEKAQTEASWFSLGMRLDFLFIDMVRFWFLRKRLRKEGYDYLISDRFFYDSIINIEYLASKLSRGKETILSGATFLAHYMPKVDQAFYFDIAPDMILSRERVPEQGKEYLEKKVHLFKQKLLLWHMESIDATEDKNDIHEEILRRIKSS